MQLYGISFLYASKHAGKVEDNLKNYSRRGRKHGVCREGMTCISRESKWRGNAALDLYSGSVRFEIRAEHRLYPNLRFFAVFISSSRNISQDNVSIWALLRPCKTLIHTQIHIYIHTHTHTYIRTYIHTYTHAYIYTHTHIHTYIQTHT